MNIIIQFPLAFKFLIFLCLSILFFSNHLYSGEIVVGYYASWLRSTLPAENIIFKNLTHINHAFAWPDQNGQIVLSENLLYPQLNNLAHQNNVKVSISLGGWGNSEGFSPMIADSTLRSVFIENIVIFLNTYNYDGIDLDWEFPNTISDRNNLTILVRELRDRFNSENPGWLITMAVGTSDWKGQWYDYSELIQYVDWFNAMCYDFHGSWSHHSGHNAPLYQPPECNDGAIDVGMIYLNTTRGIPKNQLTVGMSFYGKEFNSTSLYGQFSDAVTDYFYYQIIPRLNEDWTYNWDNVSKVPYLTNSTNTKLITFDDTVSIRHKCEWIKGQGYLGGMIWALGQDVVGANQPLLETIGRQLITPTTIFDFSNTMKEFVLKQNYPNPFNAMTTISFSLKSAGYCQINVYDILGQKIKTLINSFLRGGNHRIIFHADNIQSGVYFYQLINAKHNEIRSMILLK